MALLALLILLASTAEGAERFRGMRPAPRFAREMVFRYAGLGTVGCGSVFAGGLAMKYEPELGVRGDMDGSEVEIGYGQFEMNGSRCGESGGSYVASAALPGVGSALWEEEEWLLLDKGRAGVEVEFVSFLKGKRLMEPAGETACRKGKELRKNLALGDQGHIVLAKDYLRKSDPRVRNEDVLYKKGWRYALVAVGFVGEGENLCLLTAGEDKFERVDEGKVLGEEEKDKKNGLGGGAIAGIIGGIIVGLMLLGSVLALAHFRK